MKLIVQRVIQASVTVKESKNIVGKIDNGLFVLVGIKRGDQIKDAEILAEKLSKLRVMADEVGKMNLIAKNFLIVSQFTLYAHTTSGNRPSFVSAAEPAEARKVYDYFVKKLKSLGLEVQTGSFGNFMEIDAKLDGPVTIILES